MDHDHNVFVSMTLPSISMDVPSHSHSVTVPAHSHDVTLPSHEHPIDYGIYEGPTVQKVSIHVDGTMVPESAIVSGEVDIVAYLSKDRSGQIQRGTTHNVSITPIPTADNPTGLAHIDATIFVMTFARSQGGGNY
jgi:hypothetical protein